MVLFSLELYEIKASETIGELVSLKFIELEETCPRRMEAIIAAKWALITY